MRVGDIHIEGLHDGEARFPATALYPRTTEADWAPHLRWLEPDGTLAFPIGCFLVRTGARVILVDAGLGPIEREGLRGGALLGSLAAAGTTPEDVTDVVFSHLHFDHVGWATQQGTIVFPNATYRCHAADWAHFVEGGEAERKLRPVEGRLETWAGPMALTPGFDVLPAPGHTPGHTAFVLSAGAERALILGDAVHCPVEWDEPDWDGISDVDPDGARRMRQDLLRRLEDTGALATAPHFPNLAWGRVVRLEGAARFTL